ncbi:NAD(P)H-dependent oxidoreductase [Dehalobacterium formicoaceticum]|uniref:NAD(P)H-dependent oxidoreductase n=1 Tax=Dehalobacterium formicoaceticum TaxID=51515 RepID=UPI000B7D41BA|nr:NAD(P)H-dependent oxidoreductase [Dehalobacterium formicoaceticum]
MQEARKFILETFQNRYTCKGYDPEKRVADEDFMVIMEAGRLSPSSMGYEPWKFVLLNNQAIKEKIRPYSWGAEKSIDGASHFVLILARSNQDMRYDSEYIQYITKEIQQFPDDQIPARTEKFKNFQEKDFKLMESERALFDWTCKQTYIPFTNMLTAAAILGVDSTPIEGFDREEVEEILIKEGVYDPEHFRLSCMIAFGYKNRDHRPKTRRRMEEVLEVFD